MRTMVTKRLRERRAVTNWFAAEEGSDIARQRTQGSKPQSRKNSKAYLDED